MVAMAGCGDGTLKTSPNTTVQRASNPDDNILKRRDTPPAGIAPQFEWFQEGNGDGEEPCPKRNAPSIVAGPGYETTLKDGPMVLQYFGLCFPGFSIHQSLRLEMRGPGGKREVLRVDAQPNTTSLSVTLVFLPNDPHGQYTLVARQGGRQAIMNLILRPAATPVLDIIIGGRSGLLESGVRRGNTVLVALAGYGAQETVTVTVQDPAGAGSQGWPSNSRRSTASGFMPCLRAVAT